MPSLLDRQIKQATRGRPDQSVNVELLIALVRQTYEEFETERRRNERASNLMEEELRAANADLARQSSATLATLIQGLGDGVIVTDDIGQIIRINPPAEQMLRLRAQEAIGRDISEFIGFAGGDAPAAEPPAAEGALEGRARSSDGHAFPVEVSTGRYVIGNEVGRLWIVRDISLRRQREAALAAAIRAAEEASRLKSQFLSTVSHELRTPLNAILGFSELIKVGLGGDEPLSKAAEYGAYIHQSGAHLLTLINDILDLSKIEAGAYRLSIDEVDLHRCIERVVAMLSAQARAKEITLRLAPGAVMDPAQADERAFNQILLNIVGNAIKFTPVGGSVTISARQTAKDCIVEVADTGPGIAEKDLPFLFEPFRQGDPTTARQHEGTGLGLAITKRLIDMQSGRISIASQVGHGTTVTIELPLASDDAALDEGVKDLPSARAGGN